ncbi:MAG: sulfotransferase [Alphaproteobacteria bacterium]|nr:sulfotransferase [Alphaproteobacteria bacterium]
MSQRLPTRLMILGMARSGTTWLASLFDAHPDVLYRHEPDVVDNGKAELPFVPAPDADLDDPELLAGARTYLERLSRNSSLKAVGSVRLKGSKTYRPAGLSAFRTGLIYALKGVETVSRSQSIRAWPVPELISPAHAEQVFPVIKSVDSLLRVGIFARAAPECRFLTILRHPCGQLASTLRGREKGILGGPWRAEDLIRQGHGEALGFSEADVRTATDTELGAMAWALFTDFALRTLEGQSNSRIIAYEALAEDPLAETRSLYDWAGLSWHKQTEALIQESLARSGDASGYFALVRDPKAAAYKWKEQLSGEQISSIKQIAATSRAWPLVAPYS